MSAPRDDRADPGVRVTRVSRVVADGDRTLLVGGGGATEVAAQPHHEAARRLAHQMRRVTLVDVAVDGATTRCSVRGVGHRLPVERVVPVALALGLAALGVPTFVHRRD